MSSPSVHRPRSPRYGAFALALVLAWALLAGLALGLRRGPIQHDLARRAASAAASAAAGQASGVRVTYQGRDATLHGSFADPAALRRARTAVAGVDGTRTVSLGTDTRVTASGVPAIGPAPARPGPSATAGPRISAAPTVAAAPSAGSAAALPSAGATLGATTGPSPGAGPTDQVGAPVPADAGPLTLAVDRSGLTVTASVPDQAARRALVAAATDASSGRLVGDVRVVPGVGAFPAPVITGLARALAGRPGRYQVVIAPVTPSRVTPSAPATATAASGGRDRGSWSVDLSGSASSPADRSAVERAVRTAAQAAISPTVTLRDTVTVPAPAAGPGVAASIAALRAAIAAGPVRFVSGSAALTTEDRHRLDQLAAVLRAADPAPPPAGSAPAGSAPVVVGIEIDGHTDATGPAVGNAVLSRARAESAAAYLRSRGVAADRVRTAAFGAAGPRASNRTAAGRAANRRVEFVPLRLP